MPSSNHILFICLHPIIFLNKIFHFFFTKCDFLEDYKRSFFHTSFISLLDYPPPPPTLQYIHWVPHLTYPHPLFSLHPRSLFSILHFFPHHPPFIAIASFFLTLSLHSPLRPFPFPDSKFPLFLQTFRTFYFSTCSQHILPFKIHLITYPTPPPSSQPPLHKSPPSILNISPPSEFSIKSTNIPLSSLLILYLTYLTPLFFMLPNPRDVNDSVT